VASVPEGDDKPYKYPNIYRGLDVLIINKTDLIPYVEYNMDYFQKGVELLNPGLTTFPVSCRNGEGMQAWITWLKEQVKQYKQGK
jgi:hydrogenase nickel incorporation protein HypB